MAFQRRLLKELEGLRSNPLKELVDSDELRHWTIDISVLNDNPIYTGKVFRLDFKFPQGYPIESPEVKFIETPTRPIPINPHIYSNGHICLDLLGPKWTAVCNASVVCLSLQSMLNDNTSTARPPDDESYVKHAPLNPKLTRFVYHDGTV